LYKHKSGSEKLKIKLQKELKSAADEKGQTKLNVGPAGPVDCANDSNTVTPISTWRLIQNQTRGVQTITEKRHSRTTKMGWVYPPLD
jgi:hypothetical protein